MIRRPPRSTRTDTLLPYTTLFRSDQELGPKRERAGDADALALPAGEAMRVAPDVLAVEADQAHQLLDDTLALAGRADAVDGQRLGQNFTDGHAQVQRGEGILENELNLLAELHQPIAAQRQHVDLLARPFLVPRAGVVGEGDAAEIGSASC